MPFKRDFREALGINCSQLGSKSIRLTTDSLWTLLSRHSLRLREHRSVRLRGFPIIDGFVRRERVNILENHFVQGTQIESCFLSWNGDFRCVTTGVRLWDCVVQYETLFAVEI
jgi:hypothetical protein